MYTVLLMTEALRWGESLEKSNMPSILHPKYKDKPECCELLQPLSQIFVAHLSLDSKLLQQN